MNSMSTSNRIIELSKPIEAPSEVTPQTPQELVDEAKGIVELEEAFFKTLKMDRTSFLDSMRKFDERATAEPTQDFESEHWRLIQHFTKEELAYIAVTKQQEAVQLTNMLSQIMARGQRQAPAKPSIILPGQ